MVDERAFVGLHAPSAGGGMAVGVWEAFDRPTSTLSLSMPRSTGKPSNAELLTQGESYIRRKKSQAKDQVEKVVFDDNARASVLPTSPPLAALPIEADLSLGFMQRLPDRFPQAEAGEAEREEGEGQGARPPRES